MANSASRDETATAPNHENANKRDPERERRVNHETVMLASASSPKKRSPRVGLAVLCVASFLLKVGMAHMTHGLGQPDRQGSPEYIHFALSLLEHGRFTSPLITDPSDTRPSALMPPIYAALVAGIYKVMGRETPAATLTLQLINTLAVTLIIPLLFAAADGLGGRRAAWTAAVLGAVHPLYLGFTGLIWDTSLFTGGVALALWWAFRLRRDGTRSVREGSDSLRHASMFAYGLYLGFLALLNPALTVAYPFLTLWAIRPHAKGRFTLMTRWVFVTILGWLVVITPWTIRNWMQTGEFSYVRGGLWLEVWKGSCPEADTDPRRIYPDRFPLQNEGEQQRIRRLGEKAYLDECKAQALDAISSQPGRYLRLAGRRAMDFWFGTTWSQTRGFWPFTPQRRAAALFMTMETLIIFGGSVLALSRTRRDDSLVWLTAMIASFSLLYAATYMTLRFRVPIEPIVTIAAVHASGLLIRAFRPRV